MNGRTELRLAFFPDINPFLDFDFQMIAGQPVWARLFYLIRTGHAQEALREALQFQQAIEHREASFVMQFRTWIESPERKWVREISQKKTY